MFDFTSDEKALRVVCDTLGFDALAQGIEPHMVAAALSAPTNAILRPALLAYHRSLLRIADEISKESERELRTRRRKWLTANAYRIPAGSGRMRAASFMTVLPCGTVVRKRSHGLTQNLAFIGCFTDGKRLFPHIVAPEATEDARPIYARLGMGADQIAVLAVREAD